MESVNYILEHYEAADEERRLAMYLSHRDLRHLFNRIEMEAMKGSQWSRDAQSANVTVKAGRKGMAGLGWGWLKCCRLPR